jgi:anti-anti-sigma factor
MKLCHSRPQPETPNALYVMRLDGEIDLGNSAATGDWILHELDASGCRAALVDCSGLKFLDATGMSMMLRIQHHAEDAHVTLVWSRLAGLPLRAIRVVGLDHQLALIA